MPTTFSTGRFGEATEFRIAGPWLAVVAEIDRIVGALDADRAWVRLMGPFQWGNEWVVHGELREKPTVEKSRK
jgi:hypothetical protein